MWSAAVTLLVPASSSPGPVPDQDPDEPIGWRPRSDADLLLAQLRAIDRWHQLFGSASVVTGGQSREARLDEARRRDVEDREREALHRWAEAALEDEYPFGHGLVPRAVVAHRNEWVRDKLSTGLADAGVQVVAAVIDGAEASGAVVMEQPDLVFVEDLLPSLSGEELVRRTRLLAPDALVGAHVLGQRGLSPLLDAGARATFSRRIPPAEIVRELVACLHGKHAHLTMV
jgi:CheY-like chemotaxis protein